MPTPEYSVRDALLHNRTNVIVRDLDKFSDVNCFEFFAREEVLSGCRLDDEVQQKVLFHQVHEDVSI